jgi:hypothetical protein
MPSLAKLKAAKPGDIRILYTTLDAGGQIKYFAGSPDLVSAIHEWFDAQLQDHGPDATAGHDHMHH